MVGESPDTEKGEGNTIPVQVSLKGQVKWTL
jgi:hypothetical protein